MDCNCAPGARGYWAGQGPVAVIKTKKCPQWDGKYKVNVRMFNGYGGFGLQVFGAVD